MCHVLPLLERKNGQPLARTPDSMKMPNRFAPASQNTRFLLVKAALVCCLCFATALPRSVRGQSASFAGNAQHTANYPVAPQRFSSLHWSASVDLHNTGEFAHYGEPLV